MDSQAVLYVLVHVVGGTADERDVLRFARRELRFAIYIYIYKGGEQLVETHIDVTDRL